MLKAKHQTGKLARWAAVISELNLNIQYRPGRKNSNVDALSRSPLEVGVDDSESEADHSVLQVAADGSPVTNVPRETDEINKLQSKDDELHLVRQYLKDGTLPSDEKRACKILLQKDQFVPLDDVLYHLDLYTQHPLQIAVPYEMRHRLMEETTLVNLEATLLERVFTRFWHSTIGGRACIEMFTFTVGAASLVLPTEDRVLNPNHS